MTTASSALASPSESQRTSAALLVMATLVTFLAASSAPTPLYRIYQATWGFSPVMLTFIFAIYAVSLMAALLTVGALSDYIGRRPVIFGALILEAASIVMFIQADSVSWLIAARLAQGFATGAATSALGAALLDTLRARGTLVNSVAPIIGMSVGALGASVLVQFAPAPMHLVFVVLLLLFVLQGVGFFFVVETTGSKPGAFGSLRPSLQVPAHMRRAFVLVAPIVLAVWALAGFYLSLGPTLARMVSGSDAPVIGGLAVFTLTTCGAVTVWLSRGWTAPSLMRAGSLTLGLGVLITLIGVHTSLLACFFGGTALAGGGFGIAFQGAARTVLPLAAPQERAGVLSAFYVMCYLSMSVPAIIAGVMTYELNLILAMDYYGGTLVALAAIGWAASRRRAARA